MSLDPPTPVLLAGPTAVGKSEVALALAHELGGEIISVDSMQVYRGLDIGTAKPSREERASVPHHLIDVIDLRESFDAARFLQMARKTVTEIQSRGRRPLLCGGTGLYFKVFLEGLGTTPSADPGVRKQLESIPLAELLLELAQRDPETYGRIDRQNPRRVVRALEVIRLTGKPFSAQRANWGRKSGEGGPAAWAFGLCRSSGDLQRRINTRVDQMFRLGLVAETRQFLDAGLDRNRTATQALGYRQVVEHLNGQRSLEATIELVKIRTRQFAKRQMTWFRRQLHLRWVPLEANSQSGEVAKDLVRLVVQS
jgi:tRNA dimethylallyltransferase